MSIIAETRRGKGQEKRSETERRYGLVVPREFTGTLGHEDIRPRDGNNEHSLVPSLTPSPL